MNLFIKIENKGEVDHLAFNLMGASTKRLDNTKIGFFGSGNKYAIAFLLRKNIYFRIFSGEQEIIFGKKSVSFRKDKYDMITINGKDTSMTTEMGPTWEDWFIIREFYCNAMDEGDAKLSTVDNIKSIKGKTTIFIEKTPELAIFFDTIDNFILTNNKGFIESQLTEYGKIDIFEKLGNEFICYRKGIRINEKNNKNSLYRYNFDQISINEARTALYPYEVTQGIAAFFNTTKNKDYILNYLRNWKGTFEENAYWEYVNNTFSEVWHDVLKGKRVYPEKYALHSGDSESKMNAFIVPNNLASKIHKDFPDIHVIGYSKEDLYKELEMTKDESMALKYAQKKLSEIGYTINCKIIVATFFEDDVMGKYDKHKDQIIISREYFPDDSQELQNTLLEEYFHSRGAIDGQRTFVTFLIDELMIAKKKNIKHNDDKTIN